MKNGRWEDSDRRELMARLFPGLEFKDSGYLAGDERWSAPTLYEAVKELSYADKAM